MSCRTAWLLSVALAGACSGGGSSASRATAATRDGAAVTAPEPASSPSLPSETAAAGDGDDVGDVDDEPRYSDDREDDALGPGTLQVKVVWPRPDAALLRSPGRNACGEQRRPPLDVEPAGVIADRYATERIVALAGAVVALDGVAPPARDEAGEPASLVVRGCALWPRTVAVSVGESLALINGDVQRHELVITSLGGSESRAVAPLPVIGHAVGVSVTEPGVMQIATEADPEGAAYAVAVRDAYALVTDAAGVAVFHGLTAGRYVARVWHPPLAAAGEPVTATLEVTVDAGGAAKATAEAGAVTFDCPQWVEDALWDAARDRLSPAALARPLLVRAIVERSRRYTTERERIDAPAGPEDLAARALFFGVTDVAKVAIPLAELRSRGALPIARPLRVLDVGAGAGALSLGAVAALEGPVAVTAVDRDAAALRIAEDALSHRADVRAEVADVLRWRPAPRAFELVLAGTVINELPSEARLPLVRNLLAALTDDGALIIVEPALRDTSRALHELRDAVLAADLAHVFAPCVRDQVPCPMLVRDRDWCHEERPTVLPRRTRDLVAATGLRDDGLKFSYLVLRRAGLRIVDVLGGTRALRVVSRPRKLKGKIELDGCGVDGLVPLRLLRRKRSAMNRPFERARRGDIVVMTGEAEIEATDRVDRLDPSAGLEAD